MGQFENETSVESELIPVTSSNSIRPNTSTVIQRAKQLIVAKPSLFFATVVLLITATLVTRWLESATGDNRPLTLLFLIPVALSAANFGVRAGVLTSLLSLILSRMFLFSAPNTGILLPTIGDNTELAALAVGTLTVAVVTGRLRAVLEKLRQTTVELKTSELQRQRFSSEILSAVTGGVLTLCTESEIEESLPGNPDISLSLDVPADASELRHLIQKEVAARNIIPTRADALYTAATEAATNAIKHGRSGHADAWFKNDSVTVLVKDSGVGISPAQLARATLERGYSTRVSLGMGFYMMIGSVDEMVLCTSPMGTSILLTVKDAQKATIEQGILSRYSS